jgi:hypothetical protein
MRQFLIVIFLGVGLSVYAQPTQGPFYVAAKSGLFLRDQPSAKGKLIKKLMYGDKLTFEGYGLYSDTATMVEGFACDWIKVKAGKDTGYVIDPFLFPIPPPAGYTTSIDEYIRSSSYAVYDSLKVGKDDAKVEEGADITYKSLFRNGAEIQKRDAFEYHSSVYMLPNFDTRSAFHLLRLIKDQSSNLIDAKDEFPQASRDIDRGNNCKTKITVIKDKDDLKNRPGHLKFLSDCNLYFEAEIIQVENQVMIIIRRGA